MDKVVAEIIVGVLILSLLVAVIPLYRNSSDLVKTMAEKTDYQEKVKEVMFYNIPETDDIVSGRYILELFNYYDNDTEGGVFYANVIQGNSNCFLSRGYDRAAASSFVDIAAIYRVSTIYTMLVPYYIFTMLEG